MAVYSLLLMVNGCAWGDGIGNMVLSTGGAGK
jgi:hypothetical protein